MDLSGILSIAGYPGLYKMVSQMKGGLVVESLLDGKRMPAYASQKILALEDISIYTDEDDVPLADVYESFLKVTKGKAALNPKEVSVDELREYLEAILPNFDRDRVYASDLKKLFLWYNLLAEKGLLKAKEEEKPAKEDKPKKAEKKSEEKAPKKAKKKDK